MTSVSFKAPGMLRRTPLLLALLFNGCFVFAARTWAEGSDLQQDKAASSSAPRDLADLQLSNAKLLELETALNQGDYKRAETILVHEVESDPKSVRASKVLVTAAGVFFLDGQYLNAVIAWKKAEAIAPLDERSRFTLAMAYVRLNRRDWARLELEKLSTAQPRNPLYIYWLGRLDYDTRNYSSAIDNLHRVIELDPKMMRAYDTLGLCYDYLGKFDEAVKVYDRAVELNRIQPKPSPWPHLDLAVSLISLNRLSEAEKNLREAIGYDSRLPQAHYQLGRVLEMQGQYEASAQSLSQAAILDPAYPEPHYLLGRIYHRLGNEPLSKAEIDLFQQLKRANDKQPTTGVQAPQAHVY
jgi:tetratricopeptide (TPR) repeat protein